ncbi:hypothetical protein TL16_g04676 [Triparma laevis f. inornata]|uniref:Serine aminopeptidase S33 domain-containing protein n=1 Tax=Triparma laevis f. inornata TaxID=1714386 RepID=A0A9W7E6K0_9STRA|nr:hypothetical protein TL16_g04676 [Triparma laevis f. inornata]
MHKRGQQYTPINTLEQGGESEMATDGGYYDMKEGLKTVVGVASPLPLVPCMKVDSFENAQGLKVVTYSFDPVADDPKFGAKKLKGVCILLHGYGAHTQYQWFHAKTPGLCRTVYEDTTIDNLVKQGYACRTLDHQGGGRSEGTAQLRGNYLFENLVEEAEQYISEGVMKEEELKGLPIFLFGISMGGATAIRLSENNPDRYTGMVTFAPMISLEKVRQAQVFHCIKNKHLEPFIGLLACLAPTMAVAKSSPNTMFPDMQKEYENDPMCYHEDTRVIVAKSFIDITARFMGEGGFDGVQVPFATFHSVHDTLTDIEGTEALFERSKNVRGGIRSFSGWGRGWT